jgi:hypothetical protein
MTDKYWEFQQDFQTKLEHDYLGRVLSSDKPRTLVAESDVTPIEFNKENKAGASRDNGGKPQYSLVSLDCLEPMVRVLEFGAKKYSRMNYRKGFVESVIFDSLLRHISKYLSGEEIDPESGLSHIGHIQANAMFLGLATNKKDIVNAD